MSTDSPSGNGGNDKRTEQQKKDQQTRAAAAAKAAAGQKSSGSYRVTPGGDDDSTVASASRSSRNVVGGYGYGNPQPGTKKSAGDGSSPVMAGNNGKTNARTLSNEERANRGSDNRDNDAPRVAKAVAEKPAEPVLSPEEQEQQRLAAEIRQRRRRVAGYRSLLSPTRQDDLSGTLGGGGTV